ncbi:hypothetical protein Slin14017_G078670 [Septoria linicola]|nr:hypothetical protein Slin14017_G078670 [Septoria linicola]
MQTTHYAEQTEPPDGIKDSAAANGGSSGIDIGALRNSIMEQLDGAVDHFLDIMTVPEYYAATLKDYTEELTPFLLVEWNKYAKKQNLHSSPEPEAIANARVLCDTYYPVYHLAIARQLVDDIDEQIADVDRDGFTEELSSECAQLFSHLEYVFSLIRRAFVEHLGKAIPCMPSMQKCYTNIPKEGTKLESWSITEAALSDTTTGEHKSLDVLTRRLCNKTNTSFEAGTPIVLDLVAFLHKEASDTTNPRIVSSHVASMISSLAQVNSLQMQLAAFQPYQSAWKSSSAVRRKTWESMANGRLQRGAPGPARLNQRKTLEHLTGNLPVLLKHVDTAIGGPMPIELPAEPRALGVEVMDLQAIFKDIVVYTHCAPDTLSAPAGAAKAPELKTDKVDTGSENGSDGVSNALKELHVAESRFSFATWHGTGC